MQNTNDSAIRNSIADTLKALIDDYRHTDMDDTSKLAALRNSIEETKTRLAAIDAWLTGSK
jgi:hypothetical protein